MRREFTAASARLVEELVGHRERRNHGKKNMLSLIGAGQREEEAVPRGGLAGETDLRLARAVRARVEREGGRRTTTAQPTLAPLHMRAPPPPSPELVANTRP